MSEHTNDQRCGGENTHNENLELFKRAIYEALDEKFREIEKEIENIEIPPSFKRHKK